MDSIMVEDVTKAAAALVMSVSVPHISSLVLVRQTAQVSQVLKTMQSRRRSQQAVNASSPASP